jgi:hypothetical protein
MGSKSAVRVEGASGRATRQSQGFDAYGSQAAGAAPPPPRRRFAAGTETFEPDVLRPKS